jgi:photosystem II stability/assembly factor-like uncharacterized protein
LAFVGRKVLRSASTPSAKASPGPLAPTAPSFANNDGKDWQRCATPPDAEHLDFRGIQAFDASAAIVMSSGKGSLSRLYKTTDACQTWKLIFTNPDSGGFWDALQVQAVTGARSDGTRQLMGTVIGDPVNGRFRIFRTFNGDTWLAGDDSLLPGARDGESIFAASNSALLRNGGGEIFVTGGPAGSRSRVESFWSGRDLEFPF